MRSWFRGSEIFFCRFPADYDFKGLRIGSTTLSSNQVKGKGRVLHRANSAASMKCPRVLTPNLTPPCKKLYFLLIFSETPCGAAAHVFVCGCQSCVSPELTQTQRGKLQTVTLMTEDLSAVQTPPALATVWGFGVNAAFKSTGAQVLKMYWNGAWIAEKREGDRSEQIKYVFHPKYAPTLLYSIYRGKS